MKRYLFLGLCLFPLIASAHNAVGVGIGEAIVSLIFLVIAIVVPLFCGIVFMILRWANKKPRLNVGTYICFGLLVILLSLKIFDISEDVQERLLRYGNGPAPMFTEERREIFRFSLIIGVSLILITINIWKDIIDRGRKKMAIKER